MNDSIFLEGDIIELPEIVFVLSGKLTIDQTFADSLKAVSEFLIKHPELDVEIRNYTDSRGFTEANLRLSEFRAKSVVDYLIYLGIEESRLSSKGLGESGLIYSDEDILHEEDYELKEEMHRANRRTEMAVVATHR